MMCKHQSHFKEMPVDEMSVACLIVFLDTKCWGGYKGGGGGEVSSTFKPVCKIHSTVYEKLYAQIYTVT